MSKYVIDDSTLTGIADAIRTKEETSDPIPVEEMAERIGAIETGVTLPTLSNPATAAEILSGYEAIGADGEVVTGTALETASTATAADIMSGKTAYNSAGDLLTGTASAGLKVKTGSMTFSKADDSLTVSQTGIKYAIAEYDGTAAYNGGTAVGGTLVVRGGDGNIYLRATVTANKVTFTQWIWNTSYSKWKYHVFYE